MNIVIKNTVSAPTYSFDSLPTNKKNGITFSVGESDIGFVLVARRNVGVCAILIGSEAGELISDLSSRFRGSTLVRSDETLRGDLEKVTCFIKTPKAGLDLPLDVCGTPFERRVWEALRTVRVGAVITYAALARRIGQPDAVRAVAKACANNPLALAIPCHRVIRTNGALAGYRWGIERKRALIKREAIA